MGHEPRETWAERIRPCRLHTGQLLHRDGVAQSIKTGTAVLLGVGNAHPAQLTQLLDSLLGKLIVLIH